MVNQKINQSMVIMDFFKNNVIYKPIEYLRTSNNMYHVFKKVKSLHSLIDKVECFDETYSLIILRKCLIPLNTMHINGICHNNINPGCFFINGDLVLIGDFINSYIIGKDNCFGGMVFNFCQEYSSPEILRSFDNKSKESDIFSLGVVFYKMLFKKFPFSKA